MAQLAGIGLLVRAFEGVGCKVRIAAIDIRNVPPVAEFSVSALSDVVVLAGPNGVGKTRLIQSMLQAFQGGGAQANVRLLIEATNSGESTTWGKRSLNTQSPDDLRILNTALRQNRRRSDWKNSVIHFESDRTIQQIQPVAFSWELGDPWEESIGWNMTFSGLRNRFQDTVHSLFRKVQSRRDAIARRAEELMRTGSESMSLLEFPDPLAPFKRAFSQLLAPKELLDVESKSQKLSYRDGTNEFTVDALGSGEREVVNIVFDFILRNPSDCVVFFDEPELHLHPELSYKLLQALRDVGRNNQFIFCTHSPDIITAALDQSVIFVAPPRKDLQNQAVIVREDDETHQALRLLGQSIGIVALGKKIVLVEGASGSLDKQVYGSILKDRFPGLVLVPTGGKSQIVSFASVVSNVLVRSVWGIEFFMLCDRDAAPVGEQGGATEALAHGRLRVLPRYHLENYFLDECVLAKVFSRMEAEGSWLLSAQDVKRKLKDIAASMIPYTVSLVVSSDFRRSIGNIDIMPKTVQGANADGLVHVVQQRASDELRRVGSKLDCGAVGEAVRLIIREVQASLEDPEDSWKKVIPGKQLFNRFAASAGIDPGRLKLLYLREVQETEGAAFQEIVDIFEAFASFAGQ